MFSYYGAKTNIVHLYPKPIHDLIIEPFAGSARYALRYWDRDVILYDRYEVIINIWKWLQQCSTKDVLGLPRIKYSEHIDTYKLTPVERDFMGFIMGRAAETPRRTATVKYFHRPNFLNHSLKRMAGNLHKIKHWKIVLGDYTQTENRIATWFIDPPYMKGGDRYKFNSKMLNYEDLALYCRSRQGQVIVCEQKGATWLPFNDFTSHKTTNGYTKEVIWMNEKSVFNNQQLILF